MKVGKESYHSVMSSFQISVKDKGRVVIPAALRAEAGLGEEVQLIATALPEGGFIVKTRQQILRSLWDQSLEKNDGDVVIDFLHSRQAEATQRHHDLMNPVFPNLSAEQQSKQDADILAKLGFDVSK